MRPGGAGVERKHGRARDGQRLIKTRAQLAARVTAVACVVVQAEAAQDLVRFAIAWRVEGLRLHRRIGGNPAEEGSKAPAALEASAIALRTKARCEVIAGKSEAVSRKPVLGKGERAGKVGGTVARDAVEAGLEGVAVAAPQSVGKPPIREPAGQRHAQCRARPDAIIDAARIAARARRHVVRADHHGVALGAVGAAIPARPHIPARLPEDRRRRGGSFEDFGVGERDFGRLRLFCSKAHRPAREHADTCSAHTAEPAVAIHERIEHQREELVAQLERAILRPRRRLARELRQRIGEIGPRQPEEAHEVREQRPAKLKRLLIAVATFCWL